MDDNLFKGKYGMTILHLGKDGVTILHKGKYRMTILHLGKDGVTILHVIL